MSEMVNRVATAIYRDALRDLPSNDPNDPLTTWVLLASVGFARAAIAAMREPTEALLKVEGPLGRRVDNYLDDWNAVDVWRAMVDEALKD